MKGQVEVNKRKSWFSDNSGMNRIIVLQLGNSFLP